MAGVRLFFLFLLSSFAWTPAVSLGQSQTLTGPVTVGTGAESKGFANGTTDEAIRSALRRSKWVQILGGTYTINEPIALAGDGMRIEMVQGARLVVGHDDDGAGIFHVTGDDITIEGGTLLANEYVNDQQLVYVDGASSDTVDFFTLKGVRLEVSATDGTVTAQEDDNDASDAMDLLRLEWCHQPTVTGNRFLPNAGVRCVYWADGHGGSIGPNNWFGSLEYAIPRLCYEAIRMDRTQHFWIDSNHFWGLGDSLDGATSPGSDSPLNAGIYYNRGQTTDAEAEHGHFRISNNEFEAFAATRAIDLRGAIFFRIQGNKLANNRHVTADVGDCEIYLGGVVDSTDLFDRCSQGLIEGNEFHNEPQENAAFVFMQRAYKVALRDNTFTHHTNSNAVAIIVHRITTDGGPLDGATDLITTGGNFFDGHGAAGDNVSPYVILGASGSDIGIPTAIQIGDDFCWNYTGPLVSTFGIEDGVLIAGPSGLADATLSVAAESLTIGDGATGNFTELNDRVHQFLIKLQRLPFERLPPEDVLVDNTGGTDDGDDKVEAVTDLATATNALSMCIARYNAVIASGRGGPPLTMSGPRQLVVGTGIAAVASGNQLTDSNNGLGVFRASEPVLIVGFTGTAANNQVGVVNSVSAGALGMTTPVAFTDDAAGETVILVSLWPLTLELQDRTGGTPSVTNTVAPITNAATAANAFATIIPFLNDYVRRYDLQPGASTR